jgi:DnaJ-class molecular chaperone
VALKVHPDKNKDDPMAKEKFAKLHDAYKILTDPEKRTEYDETGRVGDDFNLKSYEECYNFFRNMFKRVTP